MDGDALNRFFIKYPDNFVLPIYNLLYRTNPYLPLIKRVQWDRSKGTNQTVVRTHAELPTAYDFNLAPVVPSNTGTKSACDITPVEIKRGHSTREFALMGAPFRSEWLCVRDLQTQWQVDQAVKNYEANLAEFARVWWSDYHRLRFIQMLDTKVSTKSASVLVEKVSTAADFDAITTPDVPTVALNWDLIGQMTETLLLKGAGADSPGVTEGGKPTFMLTCGPRLKRRLWLKDSLVRETVNFGDAFKNFAFRGYDNAIDGVIPNIDLFIPRLDADFEFIYPTVNANATEGRRWNINPAYKTVANGGQAVYEAAFLTVGNVFEEHVPGVQPKAFSGVKFDGVQTYTGKIQWINNADNDKNPRGEKGYYYMEMQAAAKPTHPENGYAILTLAVD